MQHDNNIENKLREMEATEQPDLSRMDAHWQQMAGMLQPPVLPLKKGWPKWMLNGFYGAAVLILLGAAIWYVLSTKNNRGENTGEKRQTTARQNDIEPKADSTAVSLPAVPAMALQDSIIKDPVTTALAGKIKINPALMYDIVSGGPYKKWTAEDSILATIKIKYTPCDECPDKKNELTGSGNSRQAKLQNLFGQLEKEEQRFVFDNSKDTLLQFKEGTVLLVPANSFGGMNGVEIRAREFYKTSDIVLNQLHTASNKEQLESGGMIYIQARLNNKPILIDSSITLKLYISDTSNNINGMQLFYGEKTGDTNVSFSTSLNWIPQEKYFSKKETHLEVRVLNLVNMSYKIKQTRKGKIAYFLFDDSITISKDSLKQILKQRYGYHKIRLVNAEWWDIWNRTWSSNGYFDSYYASKVGDSVWMEKALADYYKLKSTVTRTVSGEGNFASWLRRVSDLNTGEYNKRVLAFRGILENKCGINISSLGWINCDRFYKDKKAKIQYTVNLGDSAINYSTMLVFDKIKSIMNGYINGNKVVFQNIPIGEPVKIISIGINQKGETVYSVTHTTTSEQELKGLQFQTTSVPDLKASLSKLDN